MADKDLNQGQGQGLQQADIDASRDEYEAAFNELAAEDEAGAQRQAEMAEDRFPEEEQTKPEPAPATDSQVKDDGAPATTEGEVKSETKDKAADAGAAAESKESGTAGEYKPPTKEEYEKLQQRMKSWEGRLSAADRRANELAQKLAQVEGQRQAEAQSKGISKEEQKKKTEEIFKRYAGAYGEEDAKAIMDLASAVAEELIEQRVNQALKPIQETQQQQTKIHHEQAVQTHYQRIAQAHPDYQDFVAGADGTRSEKLNDLIAYIDEQPPYIAAGMWEVVRSGGKLGTPENVNALLTQYKKARGIIQDGGNGQKQQETKPDISEKTRQAAEAAAAVPSKRRGQLPTQMPSENASAEEWFEYYERQEAGAR